MLKKLPFNEFVLKIVALATMTLDHIGLYLLMYSGVYYTGVAHFENWMFTLGFIFRIIGRIAYPLYIFMIIQGVKHTRNFWLYFLRLSIIGITILVAQIVISIAFMDIADFSSPFIDLMVIALIVYLLKKKNKLSFLSLLTIGLLIFTFVIQVIERWNGIEILWFPAVARPSYSLITLLLGLGFYFAYDIAYVTMFKKDQRKVYPLEEVEKLEPFQSVVNIVSVAMVCLASFVLFAIAYIDVNSTHPFMVYANGLEFSNIQTYMIIASIFIFFYNGKRGYNHPWFKYFNYLYFPLHIIIIFVIFYIIFR